MQSKAFRRQLEEFINLLEEYRQQLLGAPQKPQTPAKKSDDRETPKPKPPAAKPDAEGGETATRQPRDPFEEILTIGAGSRTERDPPKTAPKPTLPTASSAPPLQPYGTLPPGYRPSTPGRVIHRPPPSETAKGKGP